MIYGIKLFDDGEGSKFDAWIGRAHRQVEYNGPTPDGTYNYNFATEDINTAYSHVIKCLEKNTKCIYEVQEYH